ncbi:MAG: Ig-like domain-containing protein [Pirellulales bacterium]|nr:Ig-like domain-containing protein [Pirellulales bacterium]
MSLPFESIGSLIWTQLWQVTLVVVLIGGLALWLGRRRPHLAYVLWLVVLLKCFTPPVWSSPTGVFSWLGADAVSAAPVVVAEPDTVEPGDNAAAVVTTAEPVEAPAAEPVVRRLPTGVVLVAVWICGAVALGGILIGRWISYTVLLRGTRIPTGALVTGLVTDLSRRLGLRRPVEVIVTTQPFGPAVCGLWRPTLILPQVLVGERLDGQVERVIAHELIHVRRGDHVVGALQVAAQALWWFHPLIWWANIRLSREREYCCDEEVVASLHCDPGKYAQSLLDVLKLRRQAQPALLPGVGASLVTEKRLEKIMDTRRTFYRRMPWLGWAVLVVGVLVVAPGAALNLAPPNTETALETQTPIPSETPPAVNTVPVTDPFGEPARQRTSYPVIVSTSPAVGATDVDPATSEITVTFDRDMAGGFSWTGGGQYYPPVAEGKRPYWKDKRTCVLPVTLKRAWYYRVGINSKSFRNFRGADGVPTPPTAVYFTTKGASDKLKAMVKKPKIVSMVPANGATDVDPGIKELRVTFNVPMGGGFSWTGGGEHYPPGVPDKRVRWSADGKTCIRPVALQPGHDYRLGLNSLSHKNFQSAGGVPLDPIVYRFRTKDE